MQFKLISLNIALAIAATASFFYPATVAASDSDKIKNMSELTCGEFLDMGMMQRMMSVVWLSGWTSREQERYMFASGRSLLSNKEKLLEENCNNNEQDLVLNQVPDWEY